MHIYCRNTVIGIFFRANKSWASIQFAVKGRNKGGQSAIKQLMTFWLILKDTNVAFKK